MQKYKVTSKVDTAKGARKYMATTIMGNVVGNMEIAKELSENTSLNITDVLAIIEQLPEVIGQHLCNGEKVSLKGLGSFQNSIVSDLMDAPEEVTPDKVKFAKISFKGDNKIKKMITKGLKCERLEDIINP